jgi:hypothetical protein
MAAVRSAGIPFGLLERLAVPNLLTMEAGSNRDNAIRRACADGIDAILRTGAIVEAITWQNPEAVATWLGAYSQGLAEGRPPSLSHKRAYREAVVARYAQRYCAKNESIGFFGPVGWATFAESEPGFVQYGSGGCRSRNAYFEVWAIAALAEEWARDSRLFPHLPVRLAPAATWDGETLRLPRRSPSLPDAISTALLSAMDGRRRVGEVLDTAGTISEIPQADLHAGLLRLRDERVAQIGFRIPHSDRPERYLRDQIKDLPARAPRSEFLAHLDGLDSALADAAAAGDTASVRGALNALAGQFVEAGCGSLAPRQKGYGRTSVYLDCRRDLDVEIGADLRGRLAAPLAILLDAARWLTTELAAAAADELRERHRLLRRQRDTVTLTDLQLAAVDLLATGGAVVPELQNDFQLRWAEILPRHADGEVQLSSEDLRPLASALFPGRPLGWAAARQHSPDLMLCRGPGGTLRWVLGELHVALNTLESRVFRTQCDDPGDLVTATAADMRHGRVVPLYPADGAEVTSRTYPPSALDPPGLYKYWSFGSDQGHPDGVAATAGTAITVTECAGGELIGCDPSGRWEAPVLEFFGEFLSALVVNLFKIRPSVPHAPRVLIDDLVVCRESWSVPAAEVPVPRRRSDDYAYDALRSWAAGLGMPRHVFMRTALEKKPLYVDFCSPLLMGTLARATRRVRSLQENSPIDFVEMLPGPEGLWLSDGDGQRYTAEFRVIAVDDLFESKIRLTSANEAAVVKEGT